MKKKKKRKSHAENTTRILRTQSTADGQLTFAGKKIRTIRIHPYDVAYTIRDAFYCLKGKVSSRRCRRRIENENNKIKYERFSHYL